MRTFQLCLPAKVTFHGLGTQGWKTVHHNHGGRYTIVHRGAWGFTWEVG
jgi:hypothetical protein